MTDPPPTKITTEGDAKVHIIDTLGDICHVLKRMSTAIIHLNDHATENVAKGTAKNLLLKQIRLISRASDYLQDKVNTVISESRMKTITNRTESRKRAASNYETRNKLKLQKRCNKNYIEIEDSILADMIVNNKPTITMKQSPRKMSMRKTNPDLPPHLQLKPKNGSVFTLKEAFLLIKNEDISANKFWDLATNRKLHPAHPQLICGRSTFFRRHKHFQTTQIIPQDDDYGSKIGAPALIENNQLCLLNKNIQDTEGLAEDNKELCNSITTVSNDVRVKGGDVAISKSPCASTVRFYQILSVQDDDDVHLVKDDKVKIKDRRRQMASTSVRNLASHIAAVAYANFIPVTEKWTGPKNLPTGCQEMLLLLTRVTGNHFKPIHPAYLLNEDCSSQYYFCGTAKNDSANNGWSRVDTDSLIARKKDAIWSPDESKNIVCKGIRIKFACGGSGGGFMYPICILVSNLSKSELPMDEFSVVPIQGLSINGHIDPRNEELGYLCLMGANVPQKHFFDWFYKEITCKTVLNIRKRFNPFSLPVGEDEEVPTDQRFVLWGDSDIPYLQKMTSPENIDLSIKKGIYFAKIGAKITETSQPLDLGPFFKILKMAGRHMTSVDTEKPLSIIVDLLFKHLRREKKLLLSGLKETALKDLLITAPEMMAAAFTKKSMTDSFVSSGMLDDKCKRCPDLFALVDSFKIDWKKVNGGKKWFMDILPIVVQEMFLEGEVNERFYDDNNFPLDKDHKGQVWTLNSNADHLTRSKVMYHSSVVSKKKEDIRLCLEAQISKELKEYRNANDVWERNKDCERLLKEMITSNSHIETVGENLSFTSASLKMFCDSKINVPLLSAFYRCRTQRDLTDKIVLPTKGSLEKIAGGEIDRKTNGPFLLQLCFDVRTLPISAKKPIRIEVRTPVMEITPPTVVEFLSPANEIDVDPVMIAWFENANKFFETKACDMNMVENFGGWNKMADYINILSNKLMFRLYGFVKLRLPLHRNDLMPGRHWVWTSFKSKVKKIAALMILNGHIIDYDILKFSSEGEVLLSNVTKFTTLDLSEMSSDIDGNYVVVDKKRAAVIRSGAAEVGILRRWKEHTSASMLKEVSHRSSKFYSSYPNSLCTEMEYMNPNVMKGYWDDLSVNLGIGIKKANMTSVISCFNWNGSERKELSLLKGSGNRHSLQEKMYKHLCYMFELAYALAIDPVKNISCNAGCEWQLQYYGK